MNTDGNLNLHEGDKDSSRVVLQVKSSCRTLLFIIIILVKLMCFGLNQIISLHGNEMYGSKQTKCN